MSSARAPRVLLTAHAAELVSARVRALGAEPVVLDGQIDGIDVAWATGDLYMDPDLARHFFGAVLGSETLRWLQVTNAGVDHPVFANLVRNGVTLTTSHVTGSPIAEYVLRAVLDWYQQAGEWRSSIAERRWENHEFREVAGTTWLVVGLGAIGSAVAQRAKAFDATVLGVRRTPRGDEPVDELVGLDAVPRADVVVLAAPANAATRGMVDDAFVGAMKPGSVLVNVGRGSLVDEAALVRALDRGDGIAAALLDVTAIEPLPDDSPLWSHPRVVLTPHSSALGHGRHGRAADVFLANLARWVRDEPLSYTVTEDELSS
jgi:phosphoglycerate dehydrogenase-like enzyme